MPRNNTSVVPPMPLASIVDNFYADTQNGFACLEALVAGVSVPVLGKGFDGRSAHDFRVKPSLPGQLQRSILQLRPGEPFYIQDLALTLVPEESHEHLVHLASGGVIPSYEEYSQHVSQHVSQMAESQILPSPSPRKSGIAHSALLLTPSRPKHIAPGRTPLVQHMVVSATHDASDSQEWPQSSTKRAVLNTLQEISRHGGEEPRQNSGDADALPPVPRVVEGSSTQDKSSPPHIDLEHARPEFNSSKQIQVTSHAQGPSLSPEAANNGVEESPELQGSGRSRRTELLLSSPGRQDSIGGVPQPPGGPQLSDEIDQQTSTHDEEIEPLEKRRRLAYSPEPPAAEESQDSLAGKTIEVAASVSRHAAIGKPRTSRKPKQSTYSHQSMSNPQTSSIDISLHKSPSESLERISSTRSTRSALKEDSHRLNVQAGGMRILFASSTSVGDSKAFKKFLTDKGVVIVQNMKDANCLCVGKGELKKTSKLISAVVLGQDIITEDWVTDSVRLQKLQDIESYRARDRRREHEWGIKLDEAIERGRQQVQVFKDLNVIFTAKAKNDLGKAGFADLKEIVMYAGAKSVGTSLPKGNSENISNDFTTFIIGSLGDADTPALKDKRFYSKDIIGLSVLRGSLNLKSDEFVIKKEPLQPKGNKKRKR